MEVSPLTILGIIKLSLVKNFSATSSREIHCSGDIIVDSQYDPSCRRMNYHYLQLLNEIDVSR